MNNKIHTFFLLLLLAPFVGSAQIAANLSYTKNPSCYGYSDGAASVSVSGGFPPYHFNWGPDQGDSNTTKTLNAGTHRVVISDEGGSLPVTFTFTLIAPSRLKGDTSNVGIPTCFGAQVTITATGGTTPYFGTGTYTSPTGSYIYIVTDAKGCRDSVPVSISAAPSLKLNVFNDTACVNGLAHVTVNATGGFPPYTGTGRFQIPGGVHYFYVYDSLGCPAIDTVEIPVYPHADITITSAITKMCSGDSIHITTNSTYNNNYTWNTGETTASIYARNAISYYLTVKDENSCNIQSNVIEISAHPTPDVSISVKGDTLTTYNGVTYQWFRNAIAIEGANSHMLIATHAGLYAVAITDSNTCHATSKAVEITGIENVLDGKVGVYPNPSSGVFKLSVTEEMIGANLSVYDINGRSVYQSEINHTQSTIALDAPAGTYLMRIQMENNTSVYRKLVKQ